MRRTPLQYQQFSRPRNREWDRTQARALWNLFSMYTRDEIAALPWSAVRAVL